jgi:hypothetical protein
VASPNEAGKQGVGAASAAVFPAINGVRSRYSPAGHVGFEHENDPADPLPGLAESVGYTKGTIAGLA